MSLGKFSWFPRIGVSDAQGSGDKGRQGSRHMEPGLLRDEVSDFLCKPQGGA